MAWMRNKPETDKTEPEFAANTRGTADVSGSIPQPATRETGMEPIVNIGQSVQIKGELSGNEDLTIEGQVDGKIVLKDHNLTIGAGGRITAEIHAKNVAVLGQVIGNIVADDKVELAATGSVQGDIRSPRVAVADGARFKGSIDMDRKGAPSAAVSTPGKSATTSSSGTAVASGSKAGGSNPSSSRDMARSARSAD